MRRLDRTGVILACVCLTSGLLITGLALLADIESDEAWSWAMVQTHSVAELSRYEPAYANNHLINSLWMKLLVERGFESVFAFRALSVCSAWAVLIWVYARFRRDWVAGSLALALLFSSAVTWPYFVWARGYGLAIAASIISAAAAERFIQETRFPWKLTSIVFAAIAALAILSFSFMLVSVVIVLFAIDAWGLCRRSRKDAGWSLSVVRGLPARLLPEIIATVLCLAYLLPTGRRVSAFDRDIPGTNNVLTMFRSIVFSHVETGSHSLSPWLGVFLKLTSVCGFLALVAVALSWVARRRHKSAGSVFSAMAGVTTLLLMCSANLVWATPFPMGRGAMPLVILSILFLVMAVPPGRLIGEGRGRRTRVFAGGAVLVALCGAWNSGTRTRELLQDSDAAIAARRVEHLTQLPRAAVPILGRFVPDDALVWYLRKAHVEVRSVGSTSEMMSCDFLVLPLKVAEEEGRSLEPDFDLVRGLGLRRSVFFQRRPTGPGSER